MKRVHPSAQLLIGSSALVTKEAASYIQGAFCAVACNTCVSCKGVMQRTHYALSWIRPEKQWYTRDELEGIVDRTSFALDEDEVFFFVIESVDKLSPACANSLLKVLEEPPAGYSFLLTATRRDLVMSTILSRCLIRCVGEEQTEARFSSWCSLFTTKKPLVPYEFDAAYEQEGIAEADVLEVLDTIFVFWMQKYQETFPIENIHVQKILNEIEYSYEHLPMPGSSKLFWRRLFIAMLAYR